MTISLKDNIAPPFYKVHKALERGEYNQFWLSGGRGSTKSSFVAIEVILGIINDPEANAVCFRKVSETIRDSIHSTFLWALDVLDVAEYFKVTVSPFEITYVKTGQKIILKGLDDPMKIKSIKVKKGYFKYLWFEELSEFDGMEEVRSVQQSVLRGGEKFIEFLSYNPPRDPQNWVNKEKEVPNKRRMVHHSTYLDVPRKWLGERFLEDAERLKETDYDLYLHEYMGHAIGLSESVIFNGKYVVESFDPTPDLEGPYMGADWGFANDPNVLVKTWIGPHHKYGANCLFIEYAVFGYKIDNNDIPEFYDQVPGVRKTRIRADCARPETISYVKNKGFDIIPCTKWTGSVEDGIRHIRSYDKIIIHTRCTEMAEEARLYSYKIDKNTKDITTKIVDAYNHGWDSVRYALGPMIQRGNGGGFIVI